MSFLPHVKMHVSYSCYAFSYLLLYTIHMNGTLGCQKYACSHLQLSDVMHHPIFDARTVVTSDVMTALCTAVKYANYIPLSDFLHMKHASIILCFVAQHVRGEFEVLLTQ